MDYLQAFVIGTAGPVWFQHIALLSLRGENEYDYSYKNYSVVLPIYFGIMTMLALYIRKSFKLSLRMSLFIISIISICFVVSLNYFVTRKIYKPYKDYTTTEWIRYILINGSRHIIAFNLIIFYFTKYFLKNYWLRVFIIGSSFFAYIMTYLSVILLDERKKLNYNYKLFAPIEAIKQGLVLVVSLYILQRKLKFSLVKSLMIFALLVPITWPIRAYILKTYNYEGDEWFQGFIKLTIYNSIKIYIVYYLIKNLK